MLWYNSECVNSRAQVRTVVLPRVCRSVPPALRFDINCLIIVRNTVYCHLDIVKPWMKRREVDFLLSLIPILCVFYFLNLFIDPCFRRDIETFLITETMMTNSSSVNGQDQMKFRVGNPVWGRGGPTAIISCFMVTLALVYACNALTMAEKEALAQIYLNYPDLSFVPLWASTDSEGVYFGKVWKRNFDEVCMSPGYDLYGIFCSEEGHVESLNVMKYWGQPISSNFDAVNGLSYLKNITTMETSSPLVEAAIRGIPQLQSASIPNLVPETFLSHSGLLKLEASEQPNLQFSNFPNLRSLKAFHHPTSSLASIASLNATLESLSFDTVYSDTAVYVSHVVTLDFPSWPRLKHLELPKVVQDPNQEVNSMSFHSNAFEYLDLFFDDFQSNLSIIVSGSSFTGLNLNGFEEIQLDCPNLKILGLQVSTLVPGDLGSLPLLEDLTISVSTPIALPALPLLKKVFLPNFASTEMFCSIVGPNLESLVASHLSVLSDCLMQASSLKKFHYDGPTLLDPMTLNKIPSSVIDLSIAQEFRASTWEYPELFRFPNLKFVSISGMKGELPSDFFVQLPKLTHVEFHSHDLIGAIPSRGWQNLESVFLNGRMTAFPGIEGTASNLKSLHIDANLNELQTIPTDQVMLAAQLNNLEYLAFHFKAQGPFPAFWTHLPKLRNVEIQSDRYSGPLPSSIGAPHLENLNLGKAGQLCGPLFSFDVTTRLNYLTLHSSQVSGPIPASWNDLFKSVGEIDLHQNFITGSLPQNWLTSNTRSISLSKNPGLIGTFKFDQNFKDFREISLSNTGISLCAQTVHNATNPSNSTFCSFGNMECPAGLCAQFWDNFCAQPYNCVPGAPGTYVAPPACHTPPPRVNTLPDTPVGKALPTFNLASLTFSLTLSLSIVLLFFSV